MARTLIVTILLLATGLSPIAGPALAVDVTDPGPSLHNPLYGYGAAVVGDRGYLVGGAQSSNQYATGILHVDAQGSVSHRADLPDGLLEPAVAALGGKVYSFGGAQATAGDLPTTTNKVHVFDPSTSRVSSPVTGMPVSVSQASAVALDGRIYVIGGFSITGDQENPGFDWRDRIYRYDTSNNRFDTMDVRLPTGRSQMAAVATGGSILLFGGVAENDQAGTLCQDPNAAVCVVDEVLRFTPDGNGGTVETITELPTRLRWATATVHQGTVYLLGGCSSNCGAHHGLDTILVIDPETGGVEQLPIKLPIKGGRRQAVTFGPIAVVPGGVVPNPAFPDSSDQPSRSDDRVHRLTLGATRPWAPADLRVNPAQEGGARLIWTAPAYDGGAPITSYEVYRASGGGEAQRLGVVEAPDASFTDGTARLGVTYAYQVRAANTAGVSALSNKALITPTATPGPPPLIAQAGDERVVIQWTEPRETGGLTIESYRLYANPKGQPESAWGELSGTYVQLDQWAPQEPIVNGETYVFRVQARNANGWGALSDPVEVVPSDVPDEPRSLTAETGLLGGQPAVNLTWEASASADVTGYAVYRGTALDALERIGEASRLTYTDSDELPRGKPLTYAVSALANGNEGPLSQAATVSFANPPSKVTGLDARWTGTGVTVWWEPPEDDGGGELEGYQVARTRGTGEPEAAGAEILDVQASPYTDGEAPRGRASIYHVRAVGTGGSGPWEAVSVHVPSSIVDSAPPRPHVSANPSTASVGERVSFDASASTDEEGVVAYHFDFGDGQSTGWTSDPSASHVYAEPGTYEATVQVRDVRGLESTEPATVVVAIGPPPEADDDLPEPRTPRSENGAPVPWGAALAALVAGALVARRRDG